MSFEVRAGEIFGISGLIGAGRTELMRLIYGADRKDGGTVSLARNAGRAAHAGADRVAVGRGARGHRADHRGPQGRRPAAAAADRGQHVARQYRQRGAARHRRREAGERARAERRSTRCGFARSGPAQIVGELSGGNQQKVVIGRWLARDCRVLLFDEPTRGIDVGAKFDIYGLMGALAREGRALVVVSSDLRELMLICDRIGVMSAGSMTGVFERDNWSQDALLAAAFAGYRSREALLHEPSTPAKQGVCHERSAVA